MVKPIKQFLIEYSNADRPHAMNPVHVHLFHGAGKHFDHVSQDHAKIANDHMGGGVGYFTSDKKIAHSYAKNASKKTGTPHIYHAELNMKHVFDVDHHFTGEHLKHVLPHEKHHEDFARGAGLLHAGVDKFKVLASLKTGSAKLTGHEVFKGLSRGNVNTAGAREHLKSKGYDGLRYNGGDHMNQATKHDVYIPYHHDSVKIHKVEKV